MEAYESKGLEVYTITNLKAYTCRQRLSSPKPGRKAGAAGRLWLCSCFVGSCVAVLAHVTELDVGYC